MRHRPSDSHSPRRCRTDGLAIGSVRHPLAKGGLAKSGKTHHGMTPLLREGDLNRERNGVATTQVDDAEIAVYIHVAARWRRT